MPSHPRARTATPPRRMASDARREQLLEVGLELFSQHPYDEVSVDAIADASGTARGLLYHYFGSKRGFYVEVLEASAAELVEVLTTDPALPPLARLDAGLRAALAWIRDHRAGYLTVLSGGIGTDPEVMAVVERVRTAIGELVVDSLPVAPDEQDAARAHVRGWVGYVEGLLPRLLNGRLEEDRLVGLAARVLFSWSADLEALVGTALDAPDPV